MDFAYFVITLIPAALIFTIIYWLVRLLVILSHIGLRSLPDPLLVPAAIVLMVAGFLIQVFIVLGWAAYVAVWTIAAADRATYAWMYLLTGFILVVGPFSWLASRESHTDQVEQEEPKANGARLYLVISAAGFLVFYFYPALMRTLYGWFLRWLLTR